MVSPPSPPSERPSAGATPDAADRAATAPAPEPTGRRDDAPPAAAPAAHPPARRHLTPPEHRRSRWWIALLVIGAVVAALVVQVVRVVRRPPAVDVATARIEDVSRLLAVTGRIEAVQTVFVSPRSAGQITEIVRREGQRVAKGDVLARLADPSATSDVLQQRAALASRQLDLKQAERDLARAAELHAAGAVATAELETARLNVARASQDVRRLAAALSTERAQLILLAPFDGMIVRRDGELGQVVGPDSAVFEIASIDAVRVSAEVDERYLRALRPGLRAEIIPFGGGGSARQPATLDYVAQAVNPQTGAATVRFTYDRPPPDVVVGMSVDVNIVVASIAQALTIPRQAVAGAGDQPYVLVEKDGRVDRRAITFEDWPAALVVVRSGLRPGEHVLLDPKSAIAGAKVRATEAPEPAPAAPTAAPTAATPPAVPAVPAAASPPASPARAPEPANAL